ncbi:PH domain-containing protein [Micromonospora auratinigra]|uniref:PH domain-containing protein n=1 Tax=Micromonospora auratinigra TaxID=261654 RepID=UPI000B884598|nr:PH domain-containing protein [Micromonospora auratinigra]
MSWTERAARPAVLAALLFAAVRAGTVLAGGLPSRGWDYLFGLSLLVLGLAALVPMVVRQRNPWRRPARLVDAGAGRRRVPPMAGFGWFAAAQVLLGAGILQSFGLDLVRDTQTPTVVGWGFTSIMFLLAAFYLLLVTGLVVAFFRGDPRIDLTPAGVEIRDLFGRRSVPWAALTPGRPTPPRSGTVLRLRVARPELVRRRGLVFGRAGSPLVTLGWLAAHPGFLADALRHYVDHPAERAAIGTPAGDDALRRALGAS